MFLRDCCVDVDLVFYFVDELRPESTPEEAHLLEGDEIVVGLRKNCLPNSIMEDPLPKSLHPSNQLFGNGCCGENRCCLTQFMTMLNNEHFSDVKFRFPLESMQDSNTEHSVFNEIGNLSNGVGKPEAMEYLELHGHKAILASRCAYFEAMFLNNFSEGETVPGSVTTITISRCKINIFKLLLEFIYTNQVSMLATLNQDANTNEIPNTYSAIAGTVSSSIAVGNDSINDIGSSGVGDGIMDTPSVKTTSLPDVWSPPEHLVADIECVLQLIMVANEYLLMDLQRACELTYSNLYDKYPCLVDMNNIARLTNVCDVCKATHLRQTCLSFIRKNFEAIRSNDDLRLEISQTPELALLFVDAISQSSNLENSHSSGSACASKSKRIRLSEDSGSVSENTIYLNATN